MLRDGFSYMYSFCHVRSKPPKLGDKRIDLPQRIKLEQRNYKGWVGLFNLSDNTELSFRGYAILVYY